MKENEEEVQLKVALYLRVSTDEQADKYGLEAQRKAIEGLIQSKGSINGRAKMVLAGKAYEYIDDGISGTVKIAERPAFARLIEDITKAPSDQKPFDLVAVYRIDRFARKLRILMDVINLFEENGIEFLSASESIDTSTPFGRAMLGIMGVIAELELETIKQRTQTGREQANLEGVAMGGHAAYGYEKDDVGRLQVLEEEAEIVKRIFTLFTVNKLPPQKIADILGEEEILSPDMSAMKHKKSKGVGRKKNGPSFWRPERIKSILSDKIYLGLRYYNKTKNSKKLPEKEWQLSPHRHEAIILTHIFELAQQRLIELSEHKALTQRKEEGHIYLLSGLLKCDHCRKLVVPEESGMMSWTGSKDRLDKSLNKYSYHYQCNRKNIKKFAVVCPVVPIPAEPLEEYVINFIKQLLSNPKAVYEYQKQLSSTKLTKTHLEASKRRFEDLLAGLPTIKQHRREQHAEGLIDINTLKVESAKLDEKGKEHQEKIDELDYQLSQIALSEGYEASLKLYAERYVRP